MKLLAECSQEERPSANQKSDLREAEPYIMPSYGDAANVRDEAIFRSEKKGRGLLHYVEMQDLGNFCSLVPAGRDLWALMCIFRTIKRTTGSRIASNNL